jgi:hypothetical protein
VENAHDENEAESLLEQNQVAQAVDASRASAEEDEQVWEASRNGNDN